MIKSNELPHIVMGACMEVHRELGPGWEDFAYRAALARELRLREIFFQTNVPVSLNYKGEKLETCANIDFLVEKRLVVLVHSLPSGFESVHKERLTSYLRHGGYPSGFLFNFDVADLRDGVKRVVLRSSEA
jgi:GxxExxY protein